MTRFRRRFQHDRRGVSTVEFAMIAPLLIVCYIGLAETCGALLAQRKASQIASEIGDLVAQSQTVTPSAVTDIFAVSNTLMVPLPTATLKIRITSITADSTGKVFTAAWTQSQGVWSPAVKMGDTMTVPAGLIAANGDVIRSEVQYTYSSPLSEFIAMPLVFNETFYLAPRESAAVLCPTCT